MSLFRFICPWRTSVSLAVTYRHAFIRPFSTKASANIVDAAAGGKFAALSSLLKETSGALPDGVFTELEQFVLKIRAYNVLLQHCENHADSEGATILLDHIVQRGLSPDVVTCSTLLSLFSKCGRLDQVRRVLDLMRNRKVAIDEDHLLEWFTLWHQKGDRTLIELVVRECSCVDEFLFLESILKFISSMRGASNQTEEAEFCNRLLLVLSHRASEMIGRMVSAKMVSKGEEILQLMRQNGLELCGPGSPLLFLYMSTGNSEKLSGFIRDCAKQKDQSILDSILEQAKRGRLRLSGSLFRLLQKEYSSTEHTQAIAEAFETGRETKRKAQQPTEPKLPILPDAQVQPVLASGEVEAVEALLKSSTMTSSQLSESQVNELCNTLMKAKKLESIPELLRAAKCAPSAEILRSLFIAMSSSESDATTLSKVLETLLAMTNDVGGDTFGFVLQFLCRQNFTFWIDRYLQAMLSATRSPSPSVLRLVSRDLARIKYLPGMVLLANLLAQKQRKQYITAENQLIESIIQQYTRLGDLGKAREWAGCLVAKTAGDGTAGASPAPQQQDSSSMRSSVSTEEYKAQDRAVIRSKLNNLLDQMDLPGTDAYLNTLLGRHKVEAVDLVCIALIEELPADHGGRPLLVKAVVTARIFNGKAHEALDLISKHAEALPNRTLEIVSNAILSVFDCEMVVDFAVNLSSRNPPVCLHPETIKSIAVILANAGHTRSLVKLFATCKPETPIPDVAVHAVARLVAKNRNDLETKSLIGQMESLAQRTFASHFVMALASSQQVARAVDVLRRFPPVDASVFNAVLNACLESKDIPLGAEVVNIMAQNNILPNGDTVSLRTRMVVAART